MLVASVLAVGAPATAEEGSGRPGAPRAAAARIDAGSEHSCALDSRGALSCWGKDTNGRLGNGAVLTADQLSPSAVDITGSIPDTWTSVSAGTSHTCALAADGTAWCWGADASGWLGNGAALTADQPSPTPVDTTGSIPDTWTAISAGSGHTCALAFDGTAWCWGTDGSARLGNGAVLTANQASPGPVDTTGSIPDTWTAISAGINHTCALAADGSAWCWGDDGSGQLGNGSGLTTDQPSPSPVLTAGAIPDTWTAISAGAVYTCGVAAEGTAWCWGTDLSGELGNGDATTTIRVSPSLVETTAPGVPDTWTAITTGLAAGTSHTCALAADGTAWCWGQDADGELGNGAAATADQSSPSPVEITGPIPDTWTAISAGSANTCAVAGDGTAWCWGEDGAGQLGNGTALTVDQPSPSLVYGPARSAAASIDAGEFHSCAIDGRGVLSCWGLDTSGQLGNGAALTADQHSPSAVDTTGAIPDTWTAISAGDLHTCALATDGTAWCWGSDGNSALGNGAALTADQPSPSAVDTTGAIPDTWTAIAAGRAHTCALAADGTAWCWGNDAGGRLGNGAALTAIQPSPTAVDTTSPIPGTWTAISAGRAHTCALAADGTAWCWGPDANGRLGNGDPPSTDQPSPSAVNTAGALPDTWTAISAGRDGTCGVAADGAAWCWGSDGQGRLGNGTALTGDQPSPSAVNTAGALPDTWGAISAGGGLTCALAVDGTAWCWGTDLNGGLGNGTALTGDQPSPSAVNTAGALPDTWTAISAGTDNMCALAADGTVWCSGSDANGQLGNGATLTTAQSSPFRTLGFYSSLPAVVRLSTTRVLGASLAAAPAAALSYDYGARPLTPLFGDWDGNGSETPGTFEGGVFKLANDHGANPTPAATFTFGDARGFPVAGDFDGDGRDDVAVFKAGTWQVRFADDGATDTFTFGTGTWPTTVPVAGDWDGDGIDGVGTYTLATGQWALRQTALASSATVVPFTFWAGSNTSYPVVGDWDGDGIDTVGVRNNVAPFTWSLNNANDAGAADITLNFGIANDLPMSWR